MTTVAEQFAAAVSADPARPLLTWYDDGTGERTELSGATLSNWVAKTANLLVDGCGLGPGDTALIALPAHWQTAAIMLACGTAGLAMAHAERPVEVAFVQPGGTADAGDVFAVGLHPFALPVTDLPPGVQDWVTAARAHGDHYGGPPADPDAPALTDLPGGGSVNHAELAQRALARAEELGIGRGDRVLIDVGAHRRPLDWLFAPVAAGASLVLSKDADAAGLERRAEVEKVTTRLF